MFLIGYLANYNNIEVELTRSLLLGSDLEIQCENLDFSMLLISFFLYTGDVFSVIC
jgi:hypothetical protein